MVEIHIADPTHKAFCDFDSSDDLRRKGHERDRMKSAWCQKGSECYNACQELLFLSRDLTEGRNSMLTYGKTSVVRILKNLKAGTNTHMHGR